MKKPFRLISGPCVLESLELGKKIAGELSDVCQKNGVEYYFKASFDKANRSHSKSYRGPGLELGLKWFAEIKKDLGVKTLTDIHLPEQAMAAAEVVDVLQIPAFLCRQTDLLVAAAEAAAKFGRVVNVKKGQFLAPWDIKNILTKFEGVVPGEQLWLTERGTTFGYGYLVVDMTSFSKMKKAGAGYTIFDGTHAVQRPSQGEVTLGERENVVLLSKSALAAGADGLFWECHPTPDLAKSDAANCLALDEVKKLIPEFSRLHASLA